MRIRIPIGDSAICIYLSPGPWPAHRRAHSRTPIWAVAWVLVWAMPWAPPALGEIESRAGEGDDAALAARLVAAGEILPLDRLLAKARAIRPGTLLDAGLNHEPEHGGYVYELRLLDGQGRVWEVELDARTGELVEHEPEGP